VIQVINNYNNAIGVEVVNYMNFRAREGYGRALAPKLRLESLYMEGILPIARVLQGFWRQLFLFSAVPFYGPRHKIRFRCIKPVGFGAPFGTNCAEVVFNLFRVVLCCLPRLLCPIGSNSVR
jgi:hypothetical protein